MVTEGTCNGGTRAFCLVLACFSLMAAGGATTYVWSGTAADDPLVPSNYSD